MKLFEHPEFEQALLQAARHHGVNEQFVEKDYYVTEILRIVWRELGDQAIFKGGPRDPTPGFWAGSWAVPAPPRRAKPDHRR